MDHFLNTFFPLHLTAGAGYVETILLIAVNIALLSLYTLAIVSVASAAW